MVDVIPLQMKPTRALLVAIGSGALIGLTRWVFECLFVVSLVPDPQSPIWVMASTVSSLFITATLALTVWIALRGLQSRSTLLVAGGAIGFLVLLGWYSTGFVNLAQMRAALIDSADSNTDADRLRELAGFKSGPGYEIDNRIAKHPNTSADVLRMLHGRPNQIGTEMCLAQNPNTPDDILLAISKRTDRWLVDALKRNPRYDELFAHDEP